MTDREKVIKGLEAHEKGCGYRSHHCDVMECPYRYGDESCDIEEMCHDALALLKYEAVEPKQVDLYGKDDWWGLVCVCPDCKAEWMSDKADTHFCPKCGQAVKWE